MSDSDELILLNGPIFARLFAWLPLSRYPLPRISQVNDGNAPTPTPTTAAETSGLVKAKSHVFHLVCFASQSFEKFKWDGAKANDHGLLKCIVLLLQDTLPDAELTEGNVIGKPFGSPEPPKRYNHARTTLELCLT